MSTIVGGVDGNLLRSNGTHVFVDEMVMIPLRGGRVVARSVYTDIPEILICGSDGTLTVHDVPTNFYSVEIFKSKELLGGVTILCAAMCAQMVAVATHKSIIVFSHSDSTQHEPTVIPLTRDIVTFLGFTPDRNQLMIGHSSGRLCSLFIDRGMLCPGNSGLQERVPATAGPQQSDAIVAAAMHTPTTVVVVCANQLQRWTLNQKTAEVLAVKSPRGLGKHLDAMFYRKKLLVLCEMGVWVVQSRKKGEKAKVHRVDGRCGWCVDASGIICWRPNTLTVKRIVV